MNRLTRIGVAAALAVVSVAALSQGGPPPGGPGMGGPGGPGGPGGAPPNQDKTAIEARQAVFKLIANQNQPIGGMFRPGGTFDAAVVARNADRIKMLAGMIPEMFARDTRQAPADVKTKALEGIWNNQADFKAKADALVAAADALATAAKSGNKDATQAANGNIGKACGGCHDTYRAK
jgi:cytochrome c556